MQNIKRALFALVATMVVAVGAIGAPTPAEARTEYWCERTLADRVGIIRCGGKTPKKNYYARVKCQWLTYVYYAAGPTVSVKSGNGSGKVCSQHMRAVNVSAVWV